MNWEQVSSALTVVLAQWVSPVNMVLAFMLGVWIVFLFRAQRGGKIDMVDTLRGEDSKASAVRVVFYGAWAVMTWTLMQYAVTKTEDPKELVSLFIAYGVMFVVPKMAEKYIEARYGNNRKDGDPRV